MWLYRCRLGQNRTATVRECVLGRHVIHGHGAHIHHGSRVGDIHHADAFAAHRQQGVILAAVVLDHRDVLDVTRHRDLVTEPLVMPTGVAAKRLAMV